MRYGIPYRGSKNKIAPFVVSTLPSGETLIDLFAGGCAVTHAALLSGKWNHIIANDIGDGPQVFEDAIHGKFADEKRWISREEFHRLKGTDPYVSLCWSYGNNRTDYLYSKESEPWKKALHYARVFGDTSLLHEFECSAGRNELESLERLHALQRLQNLERLQSLNNLQRLQELGWCPDSLCFERFQKDYREVNVPAGAIVYADPPYKDTRCTGYGLPFDYPTFEKWLAEVPFMVIVSEQSEPSGCVEVARTKRQAIIGTGNKYGSRTEKLFVQSRFVDNYRERIKHDRP